MTRQPWNYQRNEQCRHQGGYCAIDGACQFEKDCYPMNATTATPLPTVRQVNPLTASRIRTFKLVRDDDETGVSGTGTVAEGVEFSNGMCAMTWLTPMHSVAVYPNVRQLEAIHGHNGRTRVVFDT